jgi:SAM-dependent methyltransferase
LAQAYGSYRRKINDLYRQYDEGLRRLYRRLPRTTLFDPHFLLYHFYGRNLRVAAEKYARGVLVDVGCGHQPYRTFFQDRVEAYYGLDYPSTRDMLVVEGEQKQRLNAYADITNLPMREGSVDTLLCMEVLEHVPEPAAAVRECFRVVRPSGHLILTTPFLFPVHGAPHDYFRYTEYGLRHLLTKAGFTVVDVRRHGSYGAVAGLLANLYLFHSFFEQRQNYAARILLGLLKVALTVPLLALVCLGNLAGYLLDRTHGAPIYTAGYLIVGRKD